MSAFVAEALSFKRRAPIGGLSAVTLYVRPPPGSPFAGLAVPAEFYGLPCLPRFARKAIMHGSVAVVCERGRVFLIVPEEEE